MGERFVIGWLESPAFRFSLSGTLILLYWIADGAAKRRGKATAKPKSPRWVAPLIFTSLTGYYLLIGPTGGPIAGGLGNLAGILGVVASLVLRAFAPVRYPDLGARSLFYVALPIAVGVPWGLAALSLPACVATVMVCRRAEREAARLGATSPLRYRMVPGLW